VREKLFTARWLVTLGVSVCALMTSASPALGSEPAKWAICLSAKHAVEVGMSSLPLEPANGATVPAGTPVVFSAESILENAPTFSVASSPALLSSPDIDSGTGSQAGAFYRFTSTRATSTPRTIYWTASFTFTPDGCESLSTFTMPVRTLVVTPSEAELASAKRQQEEAAAKKKQEEEATAKKKEEEVAAAGIVVLDGLTINVQKGREAMVSLTCADVAPCVGKLTLAANGTTKKDRKTTAIGTAGFSIPAGNTATIELKLNAPGKALLGADHGRLGAMLSILKSSPAPSQTHTEDVHLVQQKAHGKAKA